MGSNLVKEHVFLRCVVEPQAIKGRTIVCGELDQFLDQLVGSGFKSRQRTCLSEVCQRTRGNQGEDDMCGELDQLLDQLVGSGFKSRQRTCLSEVCQRTAGNQREDDMCVESLTSFLTSW